MPDESRTKKRARRESSDRPRDAVKQPGKKDRKRKQRKAGPRPPILDLPVDLGADEAPAGSAGSVLFGWREPRKRSLCRPSSAYRFLADLNGLESTDLDPKGTYLYLGSIPNRPGRCAAIDLASGRVLTRHHPEDFEELAEDGA